MIALLLFLLSGSPSNPPAAQAKPLHRVHCEIITIHNAGLANEWTEKWSGWIWK
jgi:hypothetical protein